MKNIIRLKSFSYIASFALTLLMFSCESELDNMGYSSTDYSTDNEHIKSISSNGAIVHSYLYDQSGKIVEENCLYYFQKYIYDKNNRLVKVESAFDRSLLSSSATFTDLRKEFMTSKNSVADSYSLYHYDNVGRLSKTEHYFNETGSGFEYRSMTTFEYKGGYIVKENLHDSKGQISQYHVYTYDKNGNVSSNKYYSNLFGSKDELLSETYFKYDKYKNPYLIFNKSGSPGLNTNVNNIIETKTIRYDNTPGIDKQSSSKTKYEYNKNGYPIKEITEDSVFEYNY